MVLGLKVLLTIFVSICSNFRLTIASFITKGLLVFVFLCTHTHPWSQLLVNIYVIKQLVRHLHINKFYYMIVFRVGCHLSFLSKITKFQPYHYCLHTNFTNSTILMCFLKILSCIGHSWSFDIFFSLVQYFIRHSHWASFMPKGKVCCPLFVNRCLRQDLFPFNNLQIKFLNLFWHKALCTYSKRESILAYNHYEKLCPRKLN
jgi:hypothetical protein